MLVLHSQPLINKANSAMLVAKYHLTITPETTTNFLCFLFSSMIFVCSWKVVSFCNPSKWPSEQLGKVGNLSRAGGWAEVKVQLASLGWTKIVPAQSALCLNVPTCLPYEADQNTIWLPDYAKTRRQNLTINPYETKRTEILALCAMKHYIILTKPTKKKWFSNKVATVERKLSYSPDYKRLCTKIVKLNMHMRKQDCSKSMHKNTYSEKYFWN